MKKESQSIKKSNDSWNNNSAIEQSLSSSSRGIYTTLWTVSLRCSTETKTHLPPHTHTQMEGADYSWQQIDPRLVWTRRMMKKPPDVLETSPCYLTTSQSEESYTSCSPHPKFCLLFLSPTKIILLGLLFGTLSISTAYQVCIWQGPTISGQIIVTTRMNAGLGPRIPRFESGGERLLPC